MSYEEEAIVKEMDEHFMKIFILLSIEALAIVGLVLYILEFIGLEIFAAIVVVVFLIQAVFSKGLLEKAKDIVRRANEMQASVRGYGLETGVSVEERNNRFLTVIKMISLSSLVTPWVFLVAGALVMSQMG